MNFKKFSEKLEKIEGIPSRNEMMGELVSLYKDLNLTETQIVSYLLLGRVAPLFVKSEFNYSEKSFLNTISSFYKGDTQKLRKELGDIGEVAFQVIDEEKKDSGISLENMYEILWKIVKIQGNKSVEKKSILVVDTLSKLSRIEAKYFARIVCGNLRLGSSVRTLLDSFSKSIQDDKSLRDELDRAYGVCSDAGYIAKAVYSNGPHEALKGIKATPGIPILPRLVERTKSFDEVMERMGEKFFVQPKFDGLRLQIHKSEGGFEKSYQDRIWFKYVNKKENSSDLFGNTLVDDIRLFTRNLEDVTATFPEIAVAARGIKSNSFILDSEVIGWDFKKNTFKSYQDTMTRKRKYSIGQTSENVPVKAFSFDILFFEGDDLIGVDLEKRIKMLEKLINEDTKNDIVLAKTNIVSKKEELEKNFNTWVGMELEGLIAKLRAGGYTPGGRNFEWVKLKRSFMSDLNDSIDAVILGYYSGSGKRTKFGIGALLCGVYNKERDRFESFTKLGTGITDDMWKTILDRLAPLVVKEVPKNVVISKNLMPDVLVYPEVVCTIEADDITRSVVNGIENEPARGLSMRFPRMIEFDRDAIATDTTSVEELEEMFGK
ncbi:ATP-dependent DNA ligase [Candidatus Dojkabacteria bacterium]|jgi:DNA ligase-1|nr:ATP-dependent DNA ligase [Candidatus Dojkabacteria bacterium]